MKLQVKYFFASMAIALFGLGTHAQRATVTDDQRSLSIYEIMVGSYQHDPAGTQIGRASCRERV